MKNPHPFDHIALVYNPISTGNAAAIARTLAKNINELSLDSRSTLTPTKHAGHGIQLAKSITLRYKRPLIISVSGDGGYNEIINGVMQARSKKPTVSPVVAVAAAGNANDHKRVIRGDTPLIDLVKANQPKSLDLLFAEVKNEKKSFSRYAHSYIGLGLTPYVALELNRHKLSGFTDIWLAIKTFMRYRPFRIEYEGKKRKSDSLIFANIPEMAKVLTLNDKTAVSDSKFEVIEFSHTNKLSLLMMMVVSAVRGLKDQLQYSEFSFKTFDSQPMQLDGEVETLPGNSSVTIKNVPKVIESLY